MELIKPSYEIITPTTPAEGDALLKQIEKVARVCYQSQDKITEDGLSAQKLVKFLRDKNHQAMIEFGDIIVSFTTDRGISHELVRHRLCSFAQESTRYVSSVDITKYIVDSEETVIAAYENGNSMKQVAALSKGQYTEWEIYKILNANDIERRALGNRGLVYHDYFDIIDTPEKAYFLGFIQADGSVRKDGNQVSITQHQDVSWFLQRMVRDFIRPTASTNNDKNCHQITFVSTQLCEALFNKGIIPDKSKKSGQVEADKLWNAIPDEFKPDFIRGLMDGDGGIKFYKQTNKGETDSCCINWCGSEALMNKLSKWLLDNFDYTAKVKKDGVSPLLYRLRVSQPEIGEQVCSCMYKNFKFPYGHPVKTSRAWERIHFPYTIAQYGDQEFKVVLSSGISDSGLTPALWVWAQAVDTSEDTYRHLIELGLKPQIARSVLPTCLKTQIVIKANIREWRHIFTMRTPITAHPDMRRLMNPLLTELKELIPIVFDDLEVFNC